MDLDQPLLRVCTHAWQIDIRAEPVGDHRGMDIWRRERAALDGGKVEEHRPKGRKAERRHTDRGPADRDHNDRGRKQEHDRPSRGGGGRNSAREPHPYSMYLDSLGGSGGSQGSKRGLESMVDSGW